MLTDPNVTLMLYVPFEFSVAVPPTAHPLLPLPPVPVPGTPDPAYATDAFNQPLVGDAGVSVTPGHAIHKPAIVPV